jgi:hypothetical protein
VDWASTQEAFRQLITQHKVVLPTTPSA